MAKTVDDLEDDTTGLHQRQIHILQYFDRHEGQRASSMSGRRRVKLFAVLLYERREIKIVQDEIGHAVSHLHHDVVGAHVAMKDLRLVTQLVKALFVN